eukprot:1471201-Rhodomonas_salina.5
MNASLQFASPPSFGASAAVENWCPLRSLRVEVEESCCDFHAPNGTTGHVLLTRGAAMVLLACD